MFQNIAIVGDGSMATVCALLLESRGCRVTVWGHSSQQIDDLIQTRENRRYLPGYRIPESIRFTTRADRVFDGADLLLCAVPTQHIRHVWHDLSGHLPRGVPVVSVSKGVETSTLMRPTQVILDAGPADCPVVVLSGPSIADELARCLPATVCAACDDPELAKAVQATFTTHWFRVYTHSDVLGVELAGATKNVIALAAGILDGLQAGNNAKSALLSRGLAEITRLGVAMGAKEQTFFGVAGVGDLATTCFSPTGRNRSCGEQLGKGRKLDDILKSLPGVVEGVPTTRSVVTLAERYGIEMPITNAVHEVLFNHLDPIEAISRLMSRQPKAERVG